MATPRLPTSRPQVAVRELRQNLSRYLERAARGERLLVTDHNRPVAELGPPPATGSVLDRLIAEGRVSLPARASWHDLEPPLDPPPGSLTISEALQAERGESR